MVAEPQNTIQPETPLLGMSWVAIADGSPLPMAEVEGAEHILRYVNPAFCLLTAKLKEELVGYAFSDIAPTEEACLASLNLVYAGGQALTHIEGEHSVFDPMYRSY
jgi:two-component system NtrC family sensor kinase